MCNTFSQSLAINTAIGGEATLVYQTHLLDARKGIQKRSEGTVKACHMHNIVWTSSSHTIPWQTLTVLHTPSSFNWASASTSSLALIGICFAVFPTHSLNDRRAKTVCMWYNTTLHSGHRTCDAVPIWANTHLFLEPSASLFLLLHIVRGCSGQHLYS